LRQAYDYWQDQPGNYKKKVKQSQSSPYSLPPSPTELKRNEKKGRSPIMVVIFFRKKTEKKNTSIVEKQLKRLFNLS
jgi:hypothetical protein